MKATKTHREEKQRSQRKIRFRLLSWKAGICKIATDEPFESAALQEWRSFLRIE